MNKIKERAKVTEGLCFCRERSRMKKDTVWSAYYEDPVRFADVINGLVSTGKLLVEAKDLEEKDSVCLPPKIKNDVENTKNKKQP